MTSPEMRRRRQWPYALALIVLIPASLALPLYSGYSDVHETRNRERVVVAPANGPVTWHGATWRFLGISEASVKSGSELPTGGTHVTAALAVTPHSRAAAERLESECGFELRDPAGRRWRTNTDYVWPDVTSTLNLDLPSRCEVREDYSHRAIAVGEEHVAYASFVIPLEALPQVEMQVVLGLSSSRPVLRFAR